MIEPIDTLLTGWTAPGVWAVEAVPADVGLRARALGWHPIVVDGELSSKEAFLRAIRQAADFPDWVGNNWDAYEEVLGDLSWLPAGPVLIVLGSPVPATAIDILVDVAALWDARRRRFAVVVVEPSPDSTSATLPRLDRLPIFGQSPPMRSSGQ